MDAEADVRDDLLRRLFSEPDGVDYGTELRPWLGARAGLAVLPPTEDADEPAVVATVQITDQGKAERGLAALSAEGGGEPLHWAFTPEDDYVPL